MPIFARTSLSVLPFFTSLLSTIMEPLLSYCSSKLMHLIMVDFPDPEGPITLSTSPSSTCRLILLSALKLPKCLETLSSLIKVFMRIPSIYISFPGGKRKEQAVRVMRDRFPRRRSAALGSLQSLEPGLLALTNLASRQPMQARCL